MCWLIVWLIDLLISPEWPEAELRWEEEEPEDDEDGAAGVVHRLLLLHPSTPAHQLTLPTILYSVHCTVYNGSADTDCPKGHWFSEISITQNVAGKMRYYSEFWEVSCFPLHFVLYLGIFFTFWTVYNHSYNFYWFKNIKLYKFL